MTSPSQPVPVFRISMANATLLTGMYLGIAAVVEGLRRVTGTRLTERASLAMESFPARALEAVGAYEPIREAWLNNELSNLQVRLIYAATVAAMVFALGLAVGAVSAMFRALGQRLSPKRDEA
ncbi:MAG: hypothetical protein JNG84_13595 [Archangium sp.]|nr:hypothetical protein [Archangium sp.]